MDVLKLVTAYICLLFMVTLGPAQTYHPLSTSLIPISRSVPLVLFYHQGALLVTPHQLIHPSSPKNSTASSSYD